MEKKLLFILTKPPYGCASARESTDAILASCAFGQEVTILALGDALYQFLGDQDAEVIASKNTGAMLASLPLYGTEQFMALNQDLAARHLNKEQFIIPVNVIEQSNISDLIAQADVVLSY